MPETDIKIYYTQLNDFVSLETFFSSRFILRKKNSLRKLRLLQ